MLAIALDRYGTPLVWIKVPNQQTSEMIEGLDGEMRAKWLHEKVSESLSDMRSEAALVLTQTDKDHPVEIGSLTTGNNFADSFNKAIDMCDQNMLIGLGIPNLIIRDGNQGLGSSGSSERQVEMFHSYISSLYKDIIGRFLDQCVLQLIQYNFDPKQVTDAYDPGTIYEKPLRWSEAKVLLSGVETLTNLGYMSPEEPQDLNHAREILNLPRIQKKPKLAEVIKKGNTSSKTKINKSNDTVPGEKVDV